MHFFFQVKRKKPITRWNKNWLSLNKWFQLHTLFDKFKEYFRILYLFGQIWTMYNCIYHDSTRWTCWLHFGRHLKCKCMSGRNPWHDRLPFCLEKTGHKTTLTKFSVPLIHVGTYPTPLCHLAAVTWLNQQVFLCAYQFGLFCGNSCTI